MKHCNRPFPSVDEMDEILTGNWNMLVKPGDTVYHIGDFAWWKWTQQRVNAQVKRLNGHKFLIYGNHDRDCVKRSEGWVWKGERKKIKAFDQEIVLDHYAGRVWNKSGWGCWQLYGHSHGGLADDPNALQMDVGVDCHDYKPISFEQVREIMKTKTFVPVDHHGRSQESEDRGPQTA